jgi:autotransporter-associated beta strand protein
MRAVVVASMAIAPLAHAGTTWDGGGVNTNVTTAANWNDDVAPTFTGGTSTLTFATSGTAATLDTSLDIARLLLNAAGPFSIGASGGNTLTLQGESVSGVNTGITAALPWLMGSGTYTLSAPVILGADQAWNVSNGSGTTTLLFSGPISGAGRSLTKLGTGVLALAGANTYTGTTNVNLGTLELRSGASLAGPVAVAAPATLRFGNGTMSSLTLASALSGAGSLSVAGGGAVQVTGANSSFTGSTSVTRGELAITSAAALGSGTSAIVVVGVSAIDGSQFSTGNWVSAGGQLAVVSGSGFTLARNLQLSGYGLRNNGFGGGTLTPTLRSTGNNVLSGTVELTNGALQSSFGTLGISGPVTTAVSTGTAVLAGAQAGGNVVVSGSAVMPSGVLQVGGGGSVQLTNASNSIGRIDLSGARLEVASAAVLGGATLLQRDSGGLQIRTAAADASGFGTANLTLQVSDINSSSVFVGTARGGSDLNQTVALRFGASTRDNQGFFSAAGGHGYGLSLTGTGGGTMSIRYQRGIVFTNVGNGLLTINSDVTSAPTSYSGNGFSGGTYQWGDIEFNGSFLISNANTAMPLTMGSPGRVVMTGTQNQMTGANNLNNGTLAIRGLGALATGAINIGSTTTGAALEFLGAAGTGAGETWSRAINLPTTGTPYLFANQAGSSPTALLINGAITAGAGVKTFVIGGSNALDNTIASAIPDNSLTNFTNLQKTGPGTWLLSGNNTFTGTTTLSGGTLKLQANADGRNLLPDARPLVFGVDAFTNSAAGTLSLLGAGDVASTETTGTLTPTAGAARIMASGSGTGSAVLTISALGTRTAGATVDFAPISSGTIQFTTGPAGTSGILGGWATFGGVDWVNSGATASRFTGYTALDASSNSSSTNFSLDSGSMALPGVASVNSLKLAGSAGTTSLSLGGVLTNTTGGVLFDNSSGSAQITGSQLGAAASEVIIHTGGSGGASNVLTVGSLIGSGASSLTKSGSATLVLTANNAYTGNTTINEGTLRLSSGAALGAPGSSNRTAIRQAGTLDLAGVGMTGTAGILDGSGIVTSSAASGTVTLTVGQGNGTNGYFTGLVQDGSNGGKLGLTKLGTGIQFLTGSNSYTGPTTIGAGTLAVTSLANIGTNSGIGRGDNSSADANAASLVFNGGVLRYTGGGNGVVYQATQTPSVSIDRLFTLAGNGTIDSSGRYGSNNTVDTAASNAAVLIFSNTGAVRIAGTGARTLTLQGTVVNDSRSNTVYDNQIAMLLQNGTNTGNTLAVQTLGNTLWKLTNTGNSYSGATQVYGGFLEVGDDSSASTRTLSQNSNLDLAGGILVSTGTFARSVGTGANQVRLTANYQNYSGFAAGAGDLVVNLGSGTLSWGSPNFTATTLYLNGYTSLGTVTFASPIDLNNGSRTISVIDNFNSSFDYAIVSGVISGSGGLTKASPVAVNSYPYGPGNGTEPARFPALRLTGANTYTGSTSITLGPLVVESIGNTSSTSSNLGAGSAVVVVGNQGSLDYIGAGETTNRQIRSAANTSIAINNNGSGPLVLTNLGMNATSGASTLTLGGAYPGASEVQSNLTPAGGSINVTIGANATWTLSGSNTLGTVTLSGGSILGIGSDTALNASATLSPAVGFRISQIAAVGGARTVANNISLSAAGSAIGFTGENSLTYSGTLTIGSNDRVYVNNAIAGGTLSITGPISNAANTVVLKGSGQTVLSGSLGGSGAVAYFSGDSTAALTLSGTYAGNTTSGVTNSGPAPIIFAAATAIPGSGANLTGAAGSTLATGYAMDQTFLGRIASGALGNSFAVGLGADSSNNLNFSTASLTAASLGAVGSATRVYNGTLTPNGTTYRLGGGGGTLDFQSALTGASNSVTIGGDLTGLGGTVILSNAANSYGGATTVQRGILQVAALTNAGSNSSTGTSATINLSSGTSTGTLRYVGTGHASNRTINIQGTVGGTLDASGSGALNLTSGTISVPSNTTVTLTGTSTADNSVGAIAGTTGVNVNKTGPGLWRLTAANGFLGRLTVTSGTIVATAGVPQNGSGVFGGGNSDNQLPLVGDATPGATGQAAVLLTSGVLVDRGLEIAGPTGATQEVILGMASTSGTATFGGGGRIRLGRDVTLQAADGGTAEFQNGWKDAGGGDNPNVTFTVGSAGNAGTVIFGSYVPDSIDAVNVRRGTLRLDFQDSFGATLGYATPVTLGESGTGGTLVVNAIDQPLGSLSFTGVGSTASSMGGGTLQLFNGGTAAAAVNVTGTGHVISAAVALADNATFTLDSAARLTISSAISGSSSRSLTKAGLGILELSGTSDYTSATLVTAGQLRVNGQLGNTAVTVQSGATLGGSGRLAGSLTGDGLIAPGNSPGILTVDGQITPTGTTSFAFEFSGTGSPVWGSASASVNDVLRLTNADPFASGLTSGNIVNIYFDVASLAAGDTFLGGFFSDRTSVQLDFAAEIGSPTYAFYVFGSGSGSATSYNGKSYFTLDQYLAANPGLGITGINRSVTTVGSADFSGGTVTNGQVTQFVIIPEPSSLALAALGIAAAAWAARRRQ